MNRPAADNEPIAETIRARVLGEGFNICGITLPERIHKSGPGLDEFLTNGWHGTMAWMAKDPQRRSDPLTLWPDVKSIIVAGMNYGPERDPLSSLKRTSNGTISVHALGKDYHDVLKARLRTVARWIHQKLNAEVKIFVDTAPVMEKPLAAAAGLGWQGKHTNLVAKDYGSWLFIGSIFTTLDLDPAKSHPDYCGSCSACLDICPTDAFPEPYKLNASKCISYLTIEYKGNIPVEFRKPMGNRIYGCDDCLAVCPWNKFAKLAHVSGLHASERIEPTTLVSLAKLNDRDFRQKFSGTAIKRIGRDRFVRNVLIAIANSNDPSLLGTAEKLLTDASPLVRAMAVWACSNLAAPARFQALYRDFAAAEADDQVRSEWSAGVDANCGAVESEASS